jgi:hypothetical protein
MIVRVVFEVVVDEQAQIKCFFNYAMQGLYCSRYMRVYAFEQLYVVLSSLICRER